jgi:glycosyltransferase involved in cell wall biosynthesis
VTPLYINGKFTVQALTGVQRVAVELLRALDRQLAQRGGAGATLLLPPAGRAPGLQAVTVRRVGGVGGSLHAWEQLRLPLAARGGLLLNLSGSAPALAARQACLLHDAAVFDQPQAYAPAFRGWYRFLFRRLGRRAQALFTVSSFSRQRLAHWLEVDASRLLVTRPGADHLVQVVADPSVLARHGLHEAPFLLAVGSANPTKNLAPLVAAWRRLNRGGAARLVIAGGEHPRVFGDAGLADAPGLIRIGRVDDAALKALYEAARALVFPSVYEGFGLPPLEAMACGCPVAASTAPAVAEACGDAALAFDPGDVDAIAHAMRRLLDEPALCAALRQRGLQHAQAWRWDDAGRELLARLDTLRARS